MMEQAHHGLATDLFPLVSTTFDAMFHGLQLGSYLTLSRSYPATRIASQSPVIRSSDSTSLTFIHGTASYVDLMNAATLSYNDQRSFSRCITCVPSLIRSFHFIGDDVNESRKLSA